MATDPDNKQSVIVDKFKNEADLIGVTICKADMDTLVSLYEIKENFNKIKNLPEINYDKAIKALIPVLSKNSDKL